METVNICKNYFDLLQEINQQHGIQGKSIYLHRASGGRVYYINCLDNRKVLKLYYPMHTEAAIQSTRIITYLDNCEFPIVKIIPPLSGEKFITLNIPEGNCIGVLFDFAKGSCIGFLHRWRDNKKPLIHPKAKEFGKQVGLMHRLMDGYNEVIINKGKERYIDDLIWLLRRDGHDKMKICDIEDYGNELWEMVKKLPTGFCHGDMHTGNTVYHHSQFTWMDFDRAAISHPIIDIAWLTDGSDFNSIADNALERSRSLFDKLYEGYSMERSLTQSEISAVFHCTAIIHYDLLASITIKNNDDISRTLLDEQHNWLMRWRELCNKM